MTVKQLKEKLNKCPDNIDVKIDGFDVTSAEIVPALNEFEPYFEIIGLQEANNMDILLKADIDARLDKMENYTNHIMELLNEPVRKDSVFATFPENMIQTIDWMLDDCMDMIMVTRKQLYPKEH